MTGMPMTPYIWRMPNAARVCAATENPLLPAAPAASIHADYHVPKKSRLICTAAAVAKKEVKAACIKAAQAVLLHNHLQKTLTI